MSTALRKEEQVVKQETKAALKKLQQRRKEVLRKPSEYANYLVGLSRPGAHAFSMEDIDAQAREAAAAAGEGGEKKKGRGGGKK